VLVWDFGDENFKPDEEEQASEEDAEVDVEFQATHTLFDQTDVGPRTRDKIDRFCLSVFTASGDDYAVEYVLANYEHRPGLAQMFARYLALFVPTNGTIVNRIEHLFSAGNLLFEYQTLWLAAVLMSAAEVSAATVDRTLQYLLRGQFGEPLRGACALLIGRFGNAGQRRLLKTHYSSEASAFVRAAILYSARFFPSTERDTCYTAWSGHDDTNALIVVAAKKSGEKKVQ